MPKAEAEGGVPEGAEAGEGVGGVLLSILLHNYYGGGGYHGGAGVS